MQLDALPVFSTLKSALGFHSDRARALAENVANADTPGFVPRDIAKGDFGAALAATRLQAAGTVSTARTHDAHRAGPAAPSRSWSLDETPDSETTLDGNAVVLEEQMSKVAETRLAYESALSLYQKSMDLVRMAIKSPSR